MVTVSPDLLYKHINAFPIIRSAHQVIEDDLELTELLKMSNLMAVSRLKYNDHGIIHARIVAGTALELVDILYNAGVEMSCIRDGVASGIDEVKIMVLISSYLHDIGNSIHRINHELLGVLIARNIIDRILVKLGFDKRKVVDMRQEILHNIYASDHNIQCLSVECGIVKVSDGLDMAEGRARIPYKLGKLDMHAISAISIKRVDIEPNRDSRRPVNIVVYMSEAAGLFQLEAVLMPKIKSSGLENLLNIYIDINTKLIRYHPKE
ncbi:MAG: phosphohydrolase [Ignisphaera sp.]|nr:phosphohydrolase [Ignisphaera sp.]MCX8167781.1 phosphohydrolase [Ignisphaera sp.]MDW8085232.1 phosphohydrolase [Ignisphaera sp.]